MATRQKTTKPTKREMVMPFDGEENFVIPKRGGFGQPDNENYAMLVAPRTLGGTTTTSTEPPIQTGQGLGTSTLESGNTTSTSSPNQTQTPITPTNTTLTYESPLPPLANLPSTTIVSDESTTTPPPTTTPPIRTPIRTPILETTTTTPPCPNGTIVNGLCVETLTPPSNLPTFPSWSTLDCTTLRSEIDRLKNYMMTARFGDSTTLDAYNTQIALGETTYTSKCNATPSQPPIIAIVPTPETTSGGGGGIGGGGGGGGIGEPPSDETTTQEAPKTSSKKSWLVLLGVIGLLYLLTKKSN